MLNAMKSIFVLFLMSLFTIALIAPERVHAVPASPDIHVLEQPDGTKFNAVQWGDENQHGMETEEGYTIVLDERTNRWTYASHDFNGNLVGSSYSAGKNAPPAGLKRGIRPLNKPAVMKMLSKEKTFVSLSFSPSPTLAPQGTSGPELIVAPAGAANVPVVLVNFSDRTTTFTPTQFNTILFGTGNYSFADYYTEVSYNKFAVAAGLSSLQQWYVAPNTHNYYGSNESNWPLLAQEAAHQAVLNGFDFTAYDTDGDCKVDVLAVIHQGPGQEATGNVNDIWSHRWSLSDAGLGAYDTGQTCIANSGQHVFVDDYIIMPEKYGTGISTMGVFAHEYGHSFGLPDLYDTDYSSNGIGKWSLMAAGSWNMVGRAGDRPAHMDAWCKYSLGWVTPTKVTTPLTNQLITAASITADVYQLFNGTPPVLANSVQGTGEYFLVENRQKSGFDAGLPGTGLLVWHIDETQPANDCATFPFNYQGIWYWLDETQFNFNCTSSSRYHVALVQADNRYQLEGGACYVSGAYLYCSGNRGDAGDPFPGSTIKHYFSDTTHPFNNSKLHNGSATNVIVADISNSGPVMTASMAAQTIPQNTPPLLDALDNPTLRGTPVTFTGGWFGQALVTNYGGGAAQTGAITHGQSSYLETSVTGPVSLSFSWKVSSQPVYDYLKLTIDNVERARISGDAKWQQKWYSLSTAVTHTIRWTYVKNGSVSSGMDAGWVDKVVMNEFPRVVVSSPTNTVVVDAGSPQTIDWDAPAAAAKYKLYYSLDNGLTWKFIAADVAGNTYPWTTPFLNANKTLCKVKVIAYNSTGALVGTGIAGPFKITTVHVESPNIATTYTSGDASQNISFTTGTTLATVNSISLSYTLDGGLTWKPATPTATPAFDVPRLYTIGWTVPLVTGAPKTKCKIKVVIKSATGAVLGVDVSDAYFTITP